MDIFRVEHACRGEMLESSGVLKKKDVAQNKHSYECQGLMWLQLSI